MPEGSGDRSGGRSGEQAARPAAPVLFHVVLHEPEIPNNTGNIGRTCVATASALHLIHPIGFDTSEKACRRAGLDYWPRLTLSEHRSWDDYLATAQPRAVWLFSTKATRPVFGARFCPGDHLVFGKETAGLPDSIVRRYPDRLLTLPMMPGERSLNLATAVCAVLYEGIRQLLEAGGAVRLDEHGRLRPAAQML